MALENSKETQLKARKTRLELEAYRILEKSFGPNGLQGIIMRETIESLRATIDRKLRMMAGEDYEFFILNFSNPNSTFTRDLTSFIAVRVWEGNIESVFQLFEYPQEIRKIIYTTNAIESYNSQLRSVSYGKASFPNDEAVMKLFYLRTLDVVKKWNRSIPNWVQVLNQLLIIFGDRVGKFI